MSNLKKKVIKIVEASPKMLDNGSIMTKVKDENNLTYTFFQNKLDGSETKAYQTFKMLPNSGLGQMVEISFDEQEWSDGVKSGIRRNIAWMSPSNKQAELIPKATSSAQSTPVAVNDLDRSIRNSFAVLAFQALMPLDDATIKNIEAWMDYVKTGKIKKESPIESLVSNFNAEVVSDEEEIRIENIPF